MSSTPPLADDADAPGTTEPVAPTGPIGPREWNTLASNALIFALITWPAGLILGIIALVQIKRTGQKGKGLAIAATIWSSICGLTTAVIIAIVSVAAISHQVNRVVALQEQSTPQASATAEPHEDATAEPGSGEADSSDGGISWEGGASLSTADGFPQWADSVMSNRDWKLTSPDNGEGQWGYTSSSTGCTLDFSQTRIDPAADTRTDRDATLYSLTQILAIAGNYTPAQVKAAATEQPMAYGFGGSKALVDGLQVTASKGVVWARTIAKADVTLVILGGCSSPDDLPELTRTLQSQAIVIF
ncbi:MULTISPECIES: DUF4190 domain-containing protein [unclassified Leifsonia]|uniref:DUF4190 domain-containing protein n=1 Tax=unclassified Leifsonia TaxID=2663824 RepID=UPI0008A7D9CF|nr:MULTISPECIES: DUF4190 domain-containing protein [unclassified Leifsonia]SEI01526.1 protein of unknown function [Leifsonia sp. CL154]SFL69906.1 protein of unknown function [Leifsonia sp. CL147]